jgi:hypothetical protein
LTERDKWIKEKVGFLGPYIARIQTGAGVNVNIFFSMFLSSIFTRFKRIFSIYCKVINKVTILFKNRGTRNK